MTLLAGRWINHQVRKASIDLIHVICTFLFITRKGICRSLWKYTHYKKLFKLRNMRSKRNIIDRKIMLGIRSEHKRVLFIPPWVLEMVCKFGSNLPSNQNKEESTIKYKIHNSHKIFQIKSQCFQILRSEKNIISRFSQRWCGIVEKAAFSLKTHRQNSEFHPAICYNIHHWRPVT